MRKIKSLNALPLGKRLTVAIDIDGTIADNSKVDFSKIERNPNELLKAKPIKDALRAVKSLYKKGHIIVFHTSRNYGSKNITKKWLVKHGFPFHHIVMDKFVAHVYIDDRAINGCNWKQAMKEFKKPNLPGKLARKGGMV